jgi:hypothetical protein
MPIDLYFSLDEDYVLGPEGDLLDTSFDIFRSLWQEVRTRVKAERGDWAEHPNIGAELHELLGEVNARFTAEEGRTKIISCLTRGGFINNGALSVRYVPIARNIILYLIEIQVTNPITGESRLLKTTLNYDTDEGRVSINA